MDQISIIRLPMPPQDLKDVENILRSHDVFTLSMTDDPNIVYSAKTYLLEKFQNNTETTLLLDRQLLSRIKDITLGKQIPSARDNEDKFRLASAVLAFAVIADLKVEPNMAVYEYADSNDVGDAWRDVLILRHADNTDPNLWIDLALRRRNAMPQAATYREVPFVADDRINKPLRLFSFCKTIILKIALLELSPMTPKDKLLCLMRWMHEDFLFSATCLSFAATFWGRRKMSKMIKDLRSKDVEKRKKGIRNATWDLTFVSNWIENERKRGERCLWLAGSDDRALKKIARFVFASEAASPDEKLLTYLEGEFGSTDGKSIFGAYQGYLLRKMDVSRRANSLKTEDEKAQFGQNLRSKFESELFGLSSRS